MDYTLAKKLADCLETAHEIQEFLVQGKVQHCHPLVARLIDGIDQCVLDSIRQPTPDPARETFSKLDSKGQPSVR